MTVTQISIFLENTSGTLTTVLEILKKNDIQIIATTIAETEQYGILRLLCSHPSKALSAIREAGLAVSSSEIFAIDVEDRPGRAADIIKSFTSEGVSISYLYAFLISKHGVLVFKTDDMEKSENIIRKNGYTSQLCELMA